MPEPLGSERFRRGDYASLKNRQNQILSPIDATSPAGGRFSDTVFVGRKAASPKISSPGLPGRVLALAFVGALEGTVIALAGQALYDEALATRAAAGVLGLDSHPTDAPKGIEVDT